MSRLRELRMEHLDRLPDPCAACMFWQNDMAGRGGLGGDRDAKDAWWRAVELEWGPPGKAVWDDERLVAFAMYAPAAYVRRSRTVGPQPSEDAVVLMTMWVAPSHRSAGLARLLVQGTMREAIAHGADAVEAYGVPSPIEGPPLPKICACVVSAPALEALGFRLHRADVEHPLYRIGSERTARWPGAVGHALGEVLASIAGRERVPVAGQA